MLDKISSTPSDQSHSFYLSAKIRISMSPVRTMAALVLPPYPKPSQNAAPRATTFFRAPQSSTVAEAFLTTCSKSCAYGENLSAVYISWLKYLAAISLTRSAMCGSPSDTCVYATQPELAARHDAGRSRDSRHEITRGPVGGIRGQTHICNQSITVETPM